MHPSKQKCTLLFLQFVEHLKGRVHFINCCGCFQKKITVDFLTKKVKINEGEAPRYYVQNSHPAIISPDEFEVVQMNSRGEKNSAGQTDVRIHYQLSSSALNVVDTTVQRSGLPTPSIVRQSGGVMISIKG